MTTTVGRMDQGMNDARGLVATLPPRPNAGPGGGDGTNGIYLFGGVIGNDVWKLVRRQGPADIWHAATDKLMGTDEYGTYSPSDSSGDSFRFGDGHFGVGIVTRALRRDPEFLFPFETGIMDGAPLGGGGGGDCGWRGADGDRVGSDGGWRVTDGGWGVTDGGWRLTMSLLFGL